MRRRDFLVTAAVAACQPLVSRSLLAAPTCVEGTDIRRNSTCPIPYENNIRDRMWMWGHDSGSLGSYISAEESGGKIYPAAAVKSMGIPNVCMVPFTGTPRPHEYDQYAKQFDDPAIKRFTWSFIHGSARDSQAIKAAALRQAAKYENFVGLDMDDFFRGHAVPSPNGESAPIAPAALTPEQVIDVQKELNTTAPKCRGTKLDLSIVWYTHQINPSIKRHIDQVDVVYFWTWNANHLVDLEKNFKAFRDICPDVRVRLGVYMWNFNDKAVVPMELMKHQLDCAYRWLKSGRIEGLIFHCTPLCDMGLEAVEYSRCWIDEHGEEQVGAA
ncbi:MAG: hypothetical protein PHO07_02720 [Pirellulales bacterium]|jgi:hypothetical protein|nr:hypothetical protein [Thermoguttaceae bacterium]MDD4786061.1 hypothetical protein [Pirellulales bacterium]MDI9446978.1 hypothetical protein [Planctomycetota bacterium]